MDLVLTGHEQRVIAEVIDVCQQADDEPEAGIGEMLHVLVPLLGADKGAFCIPMNGDFVSAQMNHEPDTFARYPGRLDPLARSIDLYERHVELGVWDRRRLWYPHREAMLRSEYYNEFILPRRCHDSIGISIPLGGKPAMTSLAQVLFHHDSPKGRAFGERETAVLGLIRPAISGFVRRWRTRSAYQHPRASAVRENGLRSTHASALSRREMQVAMLIAAEGLSNKAIAQRLSLSVHTVRHHVEAVMSKLAARRRAQIAPRLRYLRE